ncbi:hypothetical protein PILCRDRAFT_7744 [Piloderma croceum F 1598]|uniref:NADH:flavin oxidoreductase/NADH oxidase N-terminal domain-containing protein n=2 Tax=Piloderma croceum (strain F 1598) TaxID=765440 RepID=A0A0C3FEI8_PILCF|nr:hypothetical protein PILCRDRAFT_7744 [Piloderma croceum F 1598]
MHSSSQKLFEPIQVGDLKLDHRVVMAPLTRFRATETHAPGPYAVEYYTQRTDTPGTLIITEATLIAEKAGGYFGVPGIWSDEQIAGWKKIVDAIRAKGSFIYLQLWALGRTADPEEIKKENPANDFIAPSAIPLTGKTAVPRPMTVAEIKEFVQLYATAASNAVHKAGFDGVEIHGANGYLVDQFLQDVSNDRTDEYGGSVENRSRFALEVIDAVVKAVGEKKTGIRFSPWSIFQDMAMKDPVPQYTDVITRIRDLYPDFSYIHVVEPRVDGSTTRNAVNSHQASQSDLIRDLWAPRPFISVGAFDRKLGLEVAEKKGHLIAYGRPFISNPDLVYRLKNNLPLAKGNRATYYGPRNWTPEGYTDYPVAVQA